MDCKRGVTEAGTTPPGPRTEFPQRKVLWRDPGVGASPTSQTTFASGRYQDCQMPRQESVNDPPRHRAGTTRRTRVNGWPDRVVR
jgi:hypothetical protein